MIRVYIIAADTEHLLRFAQATMPGRSRPVAVEALQEVVEIRDLADPQRMRALAIELHRHFEGGRR